MQNQVPDLEGLGFAVATYNSSSCRENSDNVFHSFETLNMEL
jgi:superfamily II DNA helicase RecQ